MDSLESRLWTAISFLVYSLSGLYYRLAYYGSMIYLLQIRIGTAQLATQQHVQVNTTFAFLFCLQTLKLGVPIDNILPTSTLAHVFISQQEGETIQNKF